MEPARPPDASKLQAANPRTRCIDLFASLIGTPPTPRRCHATASSASIHDSGMITVS